MGVWQTLGIERMSRDLFGGVLPISTNEHAHTVGTICSCARKLRRGKAPGPDGIPPDFWTVVAFCPYARENLLSMCQQCWEAKSIPYSWGRHIITSKLSANIFVSGGLQHLSLNDVPKTVGWKR
eukprot:8861682-Pyramimonas_sp.AAC.1